MSEPLSFTAILFYIFAAVTLLAAVNLVTARSPVHAVLWLILCFFNSAAIWVLLQAEFLGIVLVLVYVGAVMVLFLFVIMMIDTGSEQLKERIAGHMPLGLLVTFIIALEFVLILQAAGFDDKPGLALVEHGADYSNTEALGRMLFSVYIYPFEMAAVILLVAIVAAITLTLRPRKGNSKVQDIAQQVRVNRKDRIRLVKMDTEKP